MDSTLIFSPVKRLPSRCANLNSGSIVFVKKESVEVINLVAGVIIIFDMQKGGVERLGMLKD